MSGIRHKRWMGVDPNLNHRGSEISLEYGHKGDQLRSFESATRSMRMMLQYNEIFNRFARCVDNTGSDHGIGFSCGHIRESASCLRCRYFCRVQVLDFADDRHLFGTSAKFVTVNDLALRLGELQSYDPGEFISSIASAASLFDRTIVLGNFEIGIVDYDQSNSAYQPHWLPHVHLIVDGDDVDEFIRKLRSIFNEHRRQVSVSRKRFHDANRAICYAFKSPYARRNWKAAPTGVRRMELHDFLEGYSCSDLMILPKQHRVGTRHRIQISPIKDIVTWQILASSSDMIYSSVELRKVPNANPELVQLAREIALELELDWALADPATLLSHLSIQKPATASLRRLLNVRMARYRLLEC